MRAANYGSWKKQDGNKFPTEMLFSAKIFPVPLIYFQGQYVYIS